MKVNEILHVLALQILPKDIGFCSEYSMIVEWNIPLEFRTERQVY